MPKLSVIIACVNGLPTIADCLSALERQICDFDFEIIVIDRTQDKTTEYIRKNFPSVCITKLFKPYGIPQMRAIGMAQASGEFVVITEDHCIPPENWLAEIVRAHESGYPVVGGAVENLSQSRLIDWAVFLCEYSSFMPPIAAGETEFITGNNTSYSRQLIETIDESLLQNYWEYFLQKELRQMGVKFLSVPTLIIGHKKEFGFFYFLSQRFHYSRSFAAMRKRQSSFLKQFIYLLYVPILPFHLTWRIFQNVQQKRRNRKEFFMSLPLLLIFMYSYALGEFTGQLFGSGNSLLKVE
jgi:glycosyltransferase involved in cell wall biosynthesis